MPGKNTQKLQKVHCNGCRRNTLHRLLKEARFAIPDEIEGGYPISWDYVYQMYQCCGCESVVLKATEMFSETPSEKEVRYFPPPVSRHSPDWSHQIPQQMGVVLSEIYNSLNADTRALPMMGARALLDMVIVDKVGDVGTFAEKLKNLESQGFISQKNREVLDAALDAGSAAAHRGYAPKLDDVHAVMDIVENLLQAIYVLDEVAKEIKKSIPPRHAVKKKAAIP